MKAIILAGGKGSRLKPYTTILPKPLMPIGEISILEVILRQLKYYNINNISIAVGYLYEIIQAVIKDGKQFGMRVEYSLEDKPLGTAGPIGLINDISDNFIVLNGDTLTDLDYGAFMKYHQDNDAIATIATFERKVYIDFGIPETNEQGYMMEYIEKPSYNFAVSMGIYAFKPEIKKYIPNNKRLDIPDLLRTVVEDGQKIKCYKAKGFWLDIGRIDDYKTAIEEFDNNKIRFLKDYG